MRFILKVLSVLFVGGTTAFNVVACNKCVSDSNDGDSVPPDNKPVIYDVSFKEITTVNGVNFKVSDLYGRQFWLHSVNVVGSSGLPSNFYNAENRASLYVDSQEIWDQIGKVYGFDMNTGRFVIERIMRDNLLVNVFMRIRLGSYPWPTNDGVWVIESFSASLINN